MTHDVWVVAAGGGGDHGRDIETIEVFPSEAGAIGYLKNELKAYWETLKPFHTELKDFPEEWQTAQAQLAAIHTDGSWGNYALRRKEVKYSHQVVIPFEHMKRVVSSDLT